MRPLVGVAVFALAFDGGTYDLLSRHSLAVAIWWAIGLVALLGLAPRERPARSTLTVAGLLGAYAIWTALSIAWAPSAEGAFREFNRVALYLGVFILMTLLATRANAPSICDGIAIGLSAVAAIALASRFFPSHFSTRGLPEVLPSATTRLSYPVNYWNGLGILVGLTFPLLLRAAVCSRTVAARSLALAPFPALAATIYLTSSRGGVATALVGSVAFLVLTGLRWRATIAIAVAGAASAVAVAVLLGRDQLVNGPLGTATALHQGHTAAILIALLCLATAAVYAPLALYRPGFRVPTATGWAAAALAVAVGAVAITVAHPGRRFEDFKLKPSRAQQSSNFTAQHLLSGRGNGRWQFWTAAVQEFKSRPITGRGAGSYESWWAQHASFSYFTRYAHSLYLQTLGELGVIGLILLGSSFLVGLAAGLATLNGTGEPERSTIAAATATFGAFAVGAAVDWMWELTIVPVVGFACLALAAKGHAPGITPRRRLVPALAVTAIALALVIAEGLPLLGEEQIRRSQSAFNRGDLAAAVDHALTARNLEPWAASPYEQLALVDEADGRLSAARQAIAEALDRSARDWRLWLVAARIEARSGDIHGARASIRRAARLNPRSPVFASTSR